MFGMDGYTSLYIWEVLIRLSVIKGSKEEKKKREKERKREREKEIKKSTGG